MYVIMIEKTKNYGNPYDENSFYSPSRGIKTSLQSAAKYKTFEDAQPTVKELRRIMPEYFIYAIPSI